VILTYTIGQTYDHVNVETAADGSGSIVGVQNVNSGSSITVYAIARAADNSFIVNCPATWSLVNNSGNVVGGDLVASGDTTSAVFTGHLSGSANIKATSVNATGSPGFNTSGLITVPATGAVGTWNGVASGNWSVAGNWTGTGTLPPQAAGDSAVFGTGSSPVNLDTGESVGAVTLNTATAFTISGSSTLTLDNSAVGALVSMTSAAGTPAVISTPISLNDNATVTVSSGKTLNLSGVVSSTSTSKILAVTGGTGTTILGAGGANTYGPTGNSAVGTTLGGGGTIQVQNSAALGGGKLSVSGGSILQAGAASLNLANNIILADTSTTTLDNNSQGLTLSGVISSTTTGNISVINNGKLTLGGVNTFSGSTTIGTGAIVSISADSGLGTAPGSATPNSIVLNGGDLTVSGGFTLNANRGIGIGLTTGAASTTALIDAASGTLTYNGIIASAGNTGANSLTVNSEAGSTGTVVLGGANTFNGTTVITAGALELDNSLALQNSALDYSSGNLTFGSGVTSVTLPALTGASGSQNLNLTTLAAEPVALTLNNGAAASYSGQLSGSGSLTKNGSGSLTLANATYAGSTTINLGVVTVTSGSFGSSGSTISVNGSPSGGNLLVLNGGTATAQNFNVAINANETGVGATIGGNANASFANSALGAGANTMGTVTINTTGNVGLGTLTMGKDGGNGLVISSGTVTATSVDVQGAGSATAGNANLTVSGGSLTIGNSGSSGAFKVGDASGGTGHGGNLTVNGGALTYLGTDGLLAANGGGTTPHGNVTITGGIAKLTGVTLNAGNISGDTSLLTVSNGATLYLGSVGLVLNPGGGNVSATFGIGGSTIGALVDWSSVAPITLADTTTFQAADASSVAHNITLGGVLSGAGGLTKTGNGTLKLGGNNSYGGTTTVSAGTLQVNGDDSSAAGAVTVQNSGTTLGGTGTIGGAVTLQANTKLVPGDGVNPNVPLSFASTLTLDAAAASVFAVNNAAGGAVNKVAVTGALTPAGSAVHIVNTGAALVPGTYPLFNYSGGVSGPTFGATPVFDAGMAVHPASIVDNGSGQVSLVVPNTAPVVANIVTNDVGTGLSWKIAISDLKTAAVWSDSDGDAVTFSSVASLSAHGTNVTSDGTFIYYNGAVTAEDHFTYTAADPYGATAVGTVYLEAVAGVGGSIQNATLDFNGHPTFSGSGISGYTYGVESAASLSGPWINAGTVTAGGNGSWSFTDANQTSPGTIFYRLYYPYSAGNPPQ